MAVTRVERGRHRLFKSLIAKGGKEYRDGEALADKGCGLGLDCSLRFRYEDASALDKEPRLTGPRHWRS
jgi:hypothetical protein